MAAFFRARPSLAGNTLSVKRLLKPRAAKGEHAVSVTSYKSITWAPGLWQAEDVCAIVDDLVAVGNEDHGVVREF